MLKRMITVATTGVICLKSVGTGWDARLYDMTAARSLEPARDSKPSVRKFEWVETTGSLLLTLAMSSRKPPSRHVGSARDAKIEWENGRGGVRSRPRVGGARMLRNVTCRYKEAGVQGSLGGDP